MYIVVCQSINNEKSQQNHCVLLCVIRASNGSFGMLVILLGRRRRRLPVGPFPDGMITVGCFHLGFWEARQWP